jgi:hypothetical protein
VRSVDHRAELVTGVYRPILSARRGELMALQHLAPALIPRIQPILRIRPTEHGPTRDAYDFFVALRDRAPYGLRVAVDLADLPDVTTGLRAPPYDIGEDLARWGIPMLPVIGLVDSGQRLAGHGAAARLHLNRAIVRFRADDYAAGQSHATDAMRRVWRRTGLAPEQCDLLIDLAEIGCRDDVESAEKRVRRIVLWAWHHPWHSLTLAAGAMPTSLSALPTDRAQRLHRWDALLWRRVAELGLDYGDYGVSAPVPTRATPHAPVPTLRYTADDAWWIYRWARRGGRRDDRFYDLCRALVTSDHWPDAGAGFSWGDHEIARRARYTPGPGSATSWIAWGTSHHLAHIASWLAARPAPPAPWESPRIDHPR